MAPGCGVGELPTPFVFTETPQRRGGTPQTAPGNLMPFSTEPRTPGALNSLGGATLQQQTVPRPQTVLAPNGLLAQGSGLGFAQTSASTSVYQGTGAAVHCIHPLPTMTYPIGAPPSAAGIGQWFHAGMGMPVAMPSTEQGISKFWWN